MHIRVNAKVHRDAEIAANNVNTEIYERGMNESLDSSEIRTKCMCRRCATSPPLGGYPHSTSARVRSRPVVASVVGDRSHHSSPSLSGVMRKVDKHSERYLAVLLSHGHAERIITRTKHVFAGRSDSAVCMCLDDLFSLTSPPLSQTLLLGHTSPLCLVPCLSCYQPFDHVITVSHYPE